MAGLSNSLRRIHPDIVGDVDYTEKKWIEERETRVAAWKRAYVYMPDYERSKWHGVVVWEKRVNCWVAITKGAGCCRGGCMYCCAGKRVHILRLE